MISENQFFKSEREPEPKAEIEVESYFGDFVPEDFKQDPVGYFENKGLNIKSGDIKHDENGRVREDPTAVKQLPVWTNGEGRELVPIGKRVNTKKGEVGKSGNPFYEYRVMEILTDVGLPVARPIAKVEQGGVRLIIMEKIQGIGWYEKKSLELKQHGYNDADIADLKNQAEIMMTKLQERFEEAGIIRGWKLKDMIFDIDIENKKIKGLIPTDWERTTIDTYKLEKYRTKISEET